jgi:hypothetical protein
MGGAVMAAVAVLAMAVPAAAHGPGGFGFGRGADRGQALADQLGITVDELEAARTRVHEANVAQAVADGKLTQEQADLMIAGRKLKAAIDREAVMAEALGLSVEELQAAREDGTLRELIAGLDLDRVEMQERMQAAHEAAIDQAVADGVITREEADALQAAKGERGFGQGMRGHRGGMHGFQRGMRGGEGMCDGEGMGRGGKGMRGGGEGMGGRFGGFGPGSQQPPVERTTDL